MRLLGMLFCIVCLNGCTKSNPSPDKKDTPRVEIAPPPDVALADQKTAAEGDTAFAVDLYGQLRSHDGNLLFSPASIASALTMAWAGARGPTADEMKQTLHLALDADKQHAVNHKRLYDWNGGAEPDKRSYELSVANSLWGQKGESWQAEFLKLMESRYAAGLQQVDFVGAAEEARASVNQWVSKWTRAKIGEMVPPGVFTPLTRLALVNAVYFKGNWELQFAKSATHDATFNTGNRTVTVSMMHQQEHFGYGSDQDAQVLELPYKGKDLSMIVILPRARDGLPKLEASLTPVQLKRWLTNLGEDEVNVYLPRFKFDADLQLADQLKALGMRSAFDQNSANFSGMNGKKDLFISTVLHKATIETNEEGSEAAAATVVIAGVKSEAPSKTPRQIPVFRADHPFLFMIHDNRTGDFLFLGRVSDPTK